MAKVKNISGENRLLFGDLVLVGQEVEVVDGEVFSATQCTGLWEAVDDAAVAAHETGELSQRVRQVVADEVAGVPVTYPPVDAERLQVAAFVVVSDQAAVEDLTGKSVEDLRAEFSVVPVVADDGAVDGDVPDPEPKAPAKNAKRDDWAAYAATQGATPEDLDGLTQTQIRDLLGGDVPDPDPGGPDPDPTTTTTTNDGEES